jgi:hypothetical protein
MAAGAGSGRYRRRWRAQTLPDGDLFVGWGTLPYISEFSASGRLLFNAELPPGVQTYRAYRLPWRSAGLALHLGVRDRISCIEVAL